MAFHDSASRRGSAAAAAVRRDGADAAIGYEYVGALIEVAHACAQALAADVTLASAVDKNRGGGGGRVAAIASGVGEPGMHLTAPSTVSSTRQLRNRRASLLAIFLKLPHAAPTGWSSVDGNINSC